MNLIAAIKIETEIICLRYKTGYQRWNIAQYDIVCTIVSIAKAKFYQYIIGAIPIEIVVKVELIDPIGKRRI